MLTTAGVVKVLDLGLARLHVEECVCGDATASNQIMGSADYMAPEQGSSPRDADARADVYALGCTLYFALAGRPPFGDQRHSTFLAKVIAHAKEDVVPIDQIRRDVPSPLAAILAKMLAKSPNDRFFRAAEAAESLAPFCEGSDLVGLLANGGMAHSIKPSAPSVRDCYLSDSRLRLPAPSAAPVAAATHKAWQVGLRLGRWRVFSFSWEVSTRTIVQVGVGLVLLATAGLWYGRGFRAPRQGVPIARYSPDQHLKDNKVTRPPPTRGPAAKPHADRAREPRSEAPIVPRAPSIPSPTEPTLPARMAPPQAPLCPPSSPSQEPLPKVARLPAAPAYQERTDHQGRSSERWLITLPSGKKVASPVVNGLTDRLMGNARCLFKNAVMNTTFSKKFGEGRTPKKLSTSSIGFDGSLALYTFSRDQVVGDVVFFLPDRDPVTGYRKRLEQQRLEQQRLGQQRLGQQRLATGGSGAPVEKGSIWDDVGLKCGSSGSRMRGGAKRVVHPAKAYVQPYSEGTPFWCRHRVYFLFSAHGSGLRASRHRGTEKRQYTLLPRPTSFPCSRMATRTL